ncbi:hypothetical protein [Tellurirhabdus bombi]|uniref:hypothetical protein n=1 Tax=Tellurirhabdus bombi TaxID=2907205 RepID=UPI001F2947C5|nr:hypothetical protein [Tellurirhabdus bombi]
MKTIKKCFGLIVGLLVSTTSAVWAQNEQTYEEQYEKTSSSMYDRYVTGSATVFYGVGIPLSGQKAYIDRNVNQNFALGLEAVFPGHFSVGGRVGYQYVSQRYPRQVYRLSDGNVSAVQTRTLTLVPVLATASAYLTSVNSAIRPYIQAGAGGAFVDYTNYWGTLSDGKQSFRPAVAPAAGVKFLLGKSGLGAEVQAQYQHIFFKYNELSKSNSLLLSAGLSYRWY